MSSVIHIAEIAALLTIAYAIGWVVGYVMHRLVARTAKLPSPIPVERLAAVTGDAPDALVKAPVIVPVAGDPPPPVPQPEAPIPLAEPVVKTPAPAPAPALPPVSIPAVVPPPELFVRAAPPIPVSAPPAVVAPPPEPELVITAADLPPFLEPVSTAPSVPAPPAPDPGAAPALRPGEAWSGEIRGRAPTPFEPPAIVPLPVPEPVAPPIAAAPPRAADDDEDAAMRAIEGGWSRTRARAMPNAPELHDVDAAVAAASAAVQQVLLNAGSATVPGGKPLGLVRPRSGGKDDLRQIAGLGGLDESTLNNLGIFHYDQIAAWSEAEVLWMESHVFARGRIGHEDWQAQARKLAASVDG